MELQLFHVFLCRKSKPYPFFIFWLVNVVGKKFERDYTNVSVESVLGVMEGKGSFHDTLITVGDVPWVSGGFQSPLSILDFSDEQFELYETHILHLRVYSVWTY